MTSIDPRLQEASDFIELYRLEGRIEHPLLGIELEAALKNVPAGADLESHPDILALADKVYRTANDIRPSPGSPKVTTRADEKPKKVSSELAVIPTDPVTGEPLKEGDQLRGQYTSSEEFSNRDWLPQGFWARTDLLRRVFDVSLERGTSPDAVLGCVIARCAAMTPASLTIPPLRGDDAPINPFSLIRGVSGDGKTAAGKVARKLVPFDRTVREIGAFTGEGLIEQFLDEVDGEKTFSGRAVFSLVDEGKRLVETSGRSGSTTISTLLSLRTGENPGSSGATQETSRSLPVCGYRFASVMHVQPSIAERLLDWSDQGLPQRFTMFNASPIRWSFPEPENDGFAPIVPLELPTARHTAGHVRFSPEVRQQIHEAQRLISMPVQDWTPEQRAAVDAGDVELAGHAILNRITVAAVLAVMHGDTKIGSTYFELAGEVCDVSSRLWRRAQLSLESRRKRPSEGERDAERRKRRGKDVEKYRLQAFRSIAQFLQRASEGHYGEIDAGWPVKVTPGKLGKAAKGPVRGAIAQASGATGVTPSQVVQIAIDEGIITQDDDGFRIVDNWEEQFES